MSGITEDKHMAYIGFLLIMLGLAAAGEAIDRGDSLIESVVMTAAGAVLMWTFREEDEEGEKENGAADLRRVTATGSESQRGICAVRKEWVGKTALVWECKTLTQ